MRSFTDIAKALLPNTAVINCFNNHRSSTRGGIYWFNSAGASLVYRPPYGVESYFYYGACKREVDSIYNIMLFTLSDRVIAYHLIKNEKLK